MAIKENSKLNARTLNRDGTMNVIRPRLDPLKDSYHFLLSLTWPRFFILILVTYLFINTIYGSIYYLLGPNQFHGIDYHSPVDFFLECFFFSVQTLSTIGYGKISPASILANLIVTAEALTGMMAIALMTGLIFARFAKPTAKVIFCEKALITRFMGQKVFMFRMANARMNQVVEATVNLTAVQSFITPEGIPFRQQIDLPLARNKSSVFALSWTVYHVIDEKSPLFEKRIEDLRSANTELLVSLIGHDEIFSQTIFTRRSYTTDDIVYNKQFEDIIERNDNQLRVNIDKISSFRDLDS